MAEKEKAEAVKTKLLGSDAAVEAAEESRFYVDGKAVSRDAYLRAAESAGWNPVIMQEQNSFPAISTKKHGE